ncbi:hypothetical protein P4B09_07025 [Lactiplantibacillus plantarum]
MFTITATAQKYGVSNNALRYYESVGLIGGLSVIKMVSDNFRLVIKRWLTELYISGN